MFLFPFAGAGAQAGRAAGQDFRRGGVRDRQVLRQGEDPQRLPHHANTALASGRFFFRKKKLRKKILIKERRPY